MARDGEGLLGTSEVLESIIGRYKYIAGEGGQHGMTGMVLSVAAMVGSHMIDTVAAALTEITNQDVWQWCRAHLGPTVQTVRRQISVAVQTEQKRKPFRLETG